VTIGRWRSNCVGSFNGCNIHLSAIYEGSPGTYPLVMYMSAEAPITFGRETIGEPKKHGRGSLFAGEDSYTAHLERRGARLVELEMRPESSAGPQQTTNLTYNVKSRTAASGRGLEEDAVLTCSTFENSLRLVREGPASVELRSTEQDPLADLPVLEVVRGVYTEFESVASCESVATIPAADYAPFHFGRVEFDPRDLG
jgi:acetoacetate decarboxylase